jgi:DNA anti-recombination protein RmuC
MNYGYIIGPLLSLIGALLPIGALVWKMSSIVSQVKQNNKDIDALAEKVRSQHDKLDEKLEAIEKELSLLALSVARVETLLSERGERGHR